MLLIFMSGVISSYWFLTDPQRIRLMSQAYLSGLVGGPVEVGSASLTILQGLTLAHVTVHVDNGGGPDSALVVADAIEIQYNPSLLLRGKLQATRIIATGTHVNLVEDSFQGRWNYQRLRQKKEKSAVHTTEGKQLFPEVVLRDARVEYSEMDGGRCEPRGAMDFEGRAFPSSDGARYLFEVQSRGAIEGVGPVAAGEIHLADGSVTATLSRFNFGRDIQAMLPRQVRDFWIAHQLEGALDIPEFNYLPTKPGTPSKFRVRTVLRHVKLIVRARELAAADAPVDASVNAGMIQRLWSYPKRVNAVLDKLQMLPEQPPMVLEDVSGSFLFDQNGISFDRVCGSLDGATVQMNGAVSGYSSNAPMHFRLESLPGQVVGVPTAPHFFQSLPPPARVAIMMLHPQGIGTISMDIRRDLPGDQPSVTGQITILDGAFSCVFFPYPVTGATGNVVFYPDKSKTFERVELRDLHAHGIIGGPNEHCDMRLDGWVAAMNPDIGCQIRARSQDVIAEPALFQALPAPVRHAMAVFKGMQPGAYPNFRGGFDCNVFVPPGHNMRPIVSVDLNFTDGSGRFAAFPYPLEKVHGTVTVRDGYLVFNDVKMQHGPAAMDLNGRVTWPTNLPDGTDVIAKPDIRITARDVPIDDELLKVLPGDASAWIRSIGLHGTVDMDGPVVGKPTESDPNAVDYQLGVTLRNAGARPLNGDFAVSNLAGNLVIHPDHVELLALHGNRGDSAIVAAGTVNWSSGQPIVKLNGEATGLAMDAQLLKLLPDAAREAWSSLNASGNIDADLFYNGLCPALPGQPAASTRAVTTTAMPAAATLPPDFKLTIHPRGLSVMSNAIPYRLNDCSGSVVIDPDHVTITDFTGHHGKSKVVINGKGLTRNAVDWDLSLLGKDLPTDPDFRKALPPPVLQLLLGLKMNGNLGVDLKSVKYRGDHGDQQPDLDVSGELLVGDTAVDLGVPLTKIDGAMGFDAAVRRGRMVAFHGEVGLDSPELADRPVKQLKATLDLPAGSDCLNISGIQGEIAGGDIAGQVSVHLPDSGPGNYSMDFAVKNADLREVAKQVAGKGQRIQGQVSASLALQGDWTDPKTRRGRGDVMVSGKEIYQIPLLLGLMEVTNLSLPTSSPFSEGTARYLVEGQRVTFEQIQMRSVSMVMSGNGWLDFDTKKVRMNFTTENPQIPKLPIINDLVAGAREELLQIQVRGTVQNPKVSTSSLHTFTTTVDEVLTGSDQQK